MRDGARIQVHAVGDHLDHHLPARGGIERGQGRSRVAVVDRAHAVEEMGRRGQRGAPAAATQRRDRTVDGAGHLRAAAVGVPQGGDGAAAREHVDHLVGPGGLGGDGHRRESAAGDLGELAHQRRVAVGEMGGVLRPAAGLREEGTLEVDRGDLPVAMETGELGDLLTQRRGVGGDEGGDERGGAVPAVLEDRGEHLLGALGVGEGGAAAAVAVQVHQPRQDQPVVLEDAAVLGQEPCGRVGGGAGPEDPLPGAEHQGVGDQPLLEHGGAAQGEIRGRRGEVGRHGHVGGHAHSRGGTEGTGLRTGATPRRRCRAGRRSRG